MSIRPAPPRAGGDDEVGALRGPVPAGATGNGGAPRTVVYDDQTLPGPGGGPRPVEVRRVRRVLRRVDTWSVFRFAVLLYGCALVVFLASMMGLWIVATGAGAIPSIEHFITQLFALKHFHFKVIQLFLATFALGLVWVFAATLFTVIATVLYNLISDVVGGVELTMLEEHPLD